MHYILGKAVSAVPGLVASWHVIQARVNASNLTERILYASDTGPSNLRF